MKRPKFQLIKTECKRCGTPLYTGNRSLWGADSAKAKYGNICNKCMTPEERAEMQDQIAHAAYAAVRA